MSEGAQRRALRLAALRTDCVDELDAPGARRRATMSRLGHGDPAPVISGWPGGTPEQFGADGTTALASDAVTIDISPRPYSLGIGGLTRVALSGKELRRIQERMVIRLLLVLACELLARARTRPWCLATFQTFGTRPRYR